MKITSLGRPAPVQPLHAPAGTSSLCSSIGRWCSGMATRVGGPSSRPALPLSPSPPSLAAGAVLDDSTLSSLSPLPLAVGAVPADDPWPPPLPPPLAAGAVPAGGPPVIVSRRSGSGVASAAFVKRSNRTAVGLDTSH